MSKNIYPLKQIIEIKQRRVEEAEKVVKEKQLVLEKEQQKLVEKQQARDKVRNHQIDKLTQLRETLDHAMTSPKVQQMKVYLKVVDEKLKIEEKKVKDQQEVVKNAEKSLEKAKEELHIKRQEVDKFLTHQTDWIKERRKEMEIIEGREQDELGSVIYSSQKLKKMSSFN